MMVHVHIKYQGSRPCGVRQEDFFMFSYISDRYMEQLINFPV